MYFGKHNKHIKAIGIIGASLILCGSVAAYADVADPWPGPRPHTHEGREADAAMPDVNFGIEENGALAMYFHFSAPCQYQYAIRRADSDEMVTYGKGAGSKDSTERDVIFYESPEEGVTLHYVLEIGATFQRQTRFGNKISNDWLGKHIYIQKVDGVDKVSVYPQGRE